MHFQYIDVCVYLPPRQVFAFLKILSLHGNSKMKQKGKNSHSRWEGAVLLALHSLRIPALAQLPDGRQQLWDATRAPFGRLTVPHPRPSLEQRCLMRWGHCDHVTATGTSATPLPTPCLQSCCNILPLPMVASLINLCLIKLSSLYQINKRNLLI